MLQLSTQIEEAVRTIRQRWSARPRVGLILGTGLGGFAEHLEQEQIIRYEEIPHFPRSTAPGHKGRLVCGRAAGLSVMAMDGRLHRYEGYTAQQITLPVRVMRALGIELLIVSSAAGGLNPAFAHGDLMVIEDHINLLGDNPLVGINDDRLAPRFLDMSQPYDPALVARSLEIARREQIMAHRGVYVALCGPNYETRAEYRMLRTLGGDAVGMSTVPEVVLGRFCGLRVAAISTITNFAAGMTGAELSHEETKMLAPIGAAKLERVIRRYLRRRFREKS